MTDRKTLIDALKCSIKVPAEKCRDDCPYLMRTEILGELPVAPDTVINDKCYWDSCNTDQMVMDCIEMLEGLK